MSGRPLYTLSTPRSAGQQVKDAFVYLVIVCVLYYTIVLILKIITFPFRMLLTSDGQRFEAQLVRAKAKVQARELAKAKYDVSEINPLYQYLVRFKHSPDKFKGDPENASYQEWFTSLKKGDLLDTELKWAPDVYVQGAGSGRIYNKDFLDYFSRQFKLHQQADLVLKVKFMFTLQKFYPEFTPKFSVIPSELADLYERIHLKTLHNDVLKVINGSGVPVELAEGLLNELMSPAQIKAAVRIIQKCLARKYGQTMCRFCVDHNFNPDLHEDHYSNAVNNILETTKNEEMAAALVRGDITVEEITAIVDRALETSDAKELLETINHEFYMAMKSKTLNEVMGR